MTEAVFSKLSRPELNELAENDFNIDAEVLPNRGAVQDAIREAGIEFDEPVKEDNNNDADSDSVQEAPNATEATERPGHPVKFSNTGTPVYGKN